MVIEGILTTLEITGPIIGALGIRSVFARAAIETAKREAAPGVAAYRQSAAYAQPMQDEFRAPMEALRDTIHSSREMRGKVMEDMRELRIKEGKYFDSLDEVEAEMKKGTGVFARVMTRTLQYKAKHLTISPVKEKIRIINKRLAKEAAKKAAEKAAEHTAIKTAEAMAAAAGTAAVLDPNDALAATADVAQNLEPDHISAAATAVDHAVNHGVDAAHDTILHGADAASHAVHHAAKHAALHFDKLEQQIYNALDGTGVYDFAAHTTLAAKHAFTEQATHIFGHTAANHAADAITQASDLASHFSVIPGLGSAARSMWREFKMLKSEETTFTETLKSGVVPQIIRSGAIGFGIMLDGLTGGLSCGAFTVASSYAGALLANKLIEGQNQKLVDTVNGIIRDVARRYKKAIATVGAAVKAFNIKFMAKIETCPDIGKEPVLNAFVDGLVQAQQKGLVIAIDKSVALADTEIKKIPPRTWVDKVLLIDRPHEVAKLYHAAQRDIASTALGSMHHLTAAAETDPGDAVAFILEQNIFPNKEMKNILRQAEPVTIKIADDYAKNLTTWEGGCMEFWKTENEHIAEVLKEEKEDYEAYADNAYRGLRPLRRKIEANNKRLGMKAPAAA